MTYTILDLFCGAGGAAKGYHDAGFNVVGIDIKNQPRYPYEFYQADAIGYLSAMVMHGFSGIDAIHASPPCQRWSVMTKCRPGLADQYPDLVTPTRELLEFTGLPYVIENVPGAPLKSPVTLCGSQFGLTAGGYGLRRHRLFETFPFSLPEPAACDHWLPSLPVYGHGAPGNRPELRGAGFAELAREAMQIDWMGRKSMTESIPPVYTRYAGKYLMAYLRQNREAA